MFISSDPYIWDDLTCYIDPDEGILYGNASGCEMTYTSDPYFEGIEFFLYPNPASSQVTLDYSHTLTKTAEWRLSDAIGQIVKNQSLLLGSKSSSFSVEDLPNGIYFWQVQSDKEVIRAGKVTVMKQ